MSAITVTFTNPTTSVAHVFKNVMNVQWSNEYSKDLITSQTTQIGNKITRFNVNGYVQTGGTPSHVVEAQQTLEAALRAVGTGTLEYTGATDITDVRFLGLDFQEFRGNPVAMFTATFVTEATNVHAHGPVTIGGLTLNAANFFDPPRVRDAMKAQGPDEEIDNLSSREISIDGSLVGNLTNVNQGQADLIAQIQDQKTVVVGLSAASGGVSLTCRPISIEFGSPQARGSDNVARTYSFKCKTHDRYDHEPYTLGETQQVFGGSIQIDVVNSAKSTITTEFWQGQYAIKTEQFRVSGKRYFLNRGLYDAFVDNFRPLPVGQRYQSLQTYATLELTDMNIGSFKRDGNFEIGDAKRYSADIQLTYTWHKDLGLLNENVTTTRLGILWYKLGSTTHNFTIDSFGNIAQRSVSVSGQVFELDLNIAKGLIGTQVLFNDIDMPSLTEGYYITSVSINKTEAINIVGAGVLRVFDITVSANQLNTATQASHFLMTTFQVGFGTVNPLFERVTSQTKSVANRHTGGNIFEVTSITMTISGEVWDTDLSGAPANPNKNIDIFNALDATLQSSLNSPRATAVNTPTLYLPTNYSFFLNNFSIGEWQPFIKQKDPNKGDRLWKQTVSLSATAVFDLSGGGSDTAPDTIITTNETVDDETSKFTTLQVLGFGTVFKQIGVNPSTATKSIQKAYKNTTIFDAQGGASESVANPPASLGPPSAWPFAAPSDNEITKNSFENRGITNRWTQSFIATKSAGEL